MLALWGLRRRSLPGLVAAAAGAARVWRGLGGWCRLYDALGIAGGARTVGNLGVKIERGVVVAAPADRLYRFWRNVEHLPRSMSHVERVETPSDTREATPHLLAWHTLPGAPVAHAGSVGFTPIGAATRIDVSLQYDPPGGTLAHAVAAPADADAGARIERDLRKFKRALEGGRLAA